MRAVIQRVTRATVSVEGEVLGSIGTGLCVLLGATHEDGTAEVAKVARKIAQLRILRNTEGEDDPNQRVSAEESHAPILLVSQFTLYADVRKGRKPGWSHAAPGPVAEPLVQAVANELRATYGLDVDEGKFGAMMEVEIVNDGPFTILVEA
ncbi:MAG: D-aminoacyl-tRNA deacylase [Ancrocorticia sp.]|uniref:D-aminoacyl-tRNA deacylase n=1 Tax=Ancrocorticia sp. TaxID=2593684 RepID=UPI003F9071BE